MDKKQLAEWSSRPRPELSEAVAADIRDHLATIPSREDIYGYAIMPDDPSTCANGLASLGAIYNRASDINVGADQPNFAYYKYGVDEWHNWDPYKFLRSDSVLASLNAEFAAAHVREGDTYEFDQFEQAFTTSLLGAILEGMELAKSQGLFSSNFEYLVIWISDSDYPIMEESVRRLNSAAVVEAYLAEFGSAG